MGKMKCSNFIGEKKHKKTTQKVHVNRTFQPNLCGLIRNKLLIMYGLSAVSNI